MLFSMLAHHIYNDLPINFCDRNTHLTRLVYCFLGIFFLDNILLFILHFILLEEFFCFFAPSTGWRSINQDFCHIFVCPLCLYKPIVKPRNATRAVIAPIFIASVWKMICGYILIRLSVAGFNNQKSLVNTSL